MFFFQEGFTYRNFLMDVLAIFIFIVWFWLLITVFSDLFRRHDISGWTKAIWVIALIVFSYIAVLAYLIFQGRGMAARNVQQAQQARDEVRRVVGFSVADEIQKLDGLKKRDRSATPNLQDYVPGSSVARNAKSIGKLFLSATCSPSNGVDIRVAHLVVLQSQARVRPEIRSGKSSLVVLPKRRNAAGERNA